MQARPSNSRNFLLCAALLAIATVVYVPSAAALWDFWTDPTHRGDQGLLVVPLSAWMLYRSRGRLSQVAARPSWLAVGLLLLGSVAWLVFWRAGIQDLHILLLPILMGLALSAALGWTAALVVAFPLAYLYFATPAWGIFSGPLRALTIHAVGVLAPLVGIPAQIQGDLVILPGVGRFEVETGCSGVNFFTAGLAVAALLGEVEWATRGRRALLLGAMGVLAIVSNWLRVLIIIDAGYTTHMRHALITRGHYTFGWVLFTLVVVAFVWLLARTPNSESPVSSTGTPISPGITAFVVSVVALAALPLTLYTIVTQLDRSALPLAYAAPAGRAGWVGPESEGTWKPDFVGAHSQWSFAYQGPAGEQVEMVAIGYPLQAQGRELVNEENSLLGATAPAPEAEAKVTLGGHSYIELIAADPRGQRAVVWSLYDIGGREFVTPLMSQLWYGLRSLGGPPYSMMFAFKSACRSSCDAARTTLGNFVQAMGAGGFGAVTHESRTSSTLRLL